MKGGALQESDSKSGGRRRTGLLIAGVIVVVVGIVAGVAIYLDQIAPFRTTVVSVGESAVSMRTFLRRTHMSGREPLAMLQTLASEEIVKRVAPHPPYGIDVREEDIDLYLRGQARGQSETITESDFKEWRRQQVNESGLSDREFNELVRTALLTRRLGDYLAERVPTVAEQAHLHMIPIGGLGAARAVKKRLDAGEDFAMVARESSADVGLKESGGDTGWHPRGALAPSIAAAVFDELAIGEISEPLFLDEEMFAVVMVSERAVRELDETVRRRLQDRVLDDWLAAEQEHHQVGFHGFKGGGYDSETDAWVRWQIQRMKRHDQVPPR